MANTQELFKKFKAAGSDILDSRSEVYLDLNTVLKTASDLKITQSFVQESTNNYIKM
jgi:hypothetical protein